MTGIALDQRALDALYTVVFCIDAEGFLRHVSPTPQRYIDDLRPGVAFFDHFTFLRPTSVASVDELLGREQALFLLKDRADRFAARGQVIELNWEGERLAAFCGSPWLFWMNAHRPDAKLSLQDFPAQDSQLDQLFLMTTEQRMVADLEKINGELQAAKRETEQAQEEKNALFARMSHEMRTPLNGVVSALALLSDQTLPDESRKLLTLAKSASSNLLHVINYVLDISKLEIGEAVLDPVLFNLPSALKSTTEIVRARAVERGLDLRWETSSQLDDVFIGDKTKLRQCLLNLTTNAIKFTDSGTVTVRALPAPDGREGIVRFEVEDTGIGIRAEDRERVFAPFWTGPEKLAVVERGTGLGLDIVRRNVEILGGTLGLTSRVGRGSIFWFEIPLQASDAAPEEPAQHQDGGTVPTRLRGRVLLVDDNETNLLLGQMILESLGLEVQQARDGASAVGRAHGEPFDLILMDISMPGMDGVTATREIRKFANREELPIVALTAFASGEERERCLRHGMNEYLTKPIVRDRLAEQLSTWLPAEAVAAHAAPPPASHSDTQGTPTLDESVLETLRSQIGGPKLGTVLDQFEGEVRMRWQAFADASRAQDAARAAREAHTLSSTCRSLGLAAAGEFFRATEVRLRAAPDAPVPDPAEAETQLQSGLAALQAFRRGGES